MVPQAIGISLRNRIGDFAGDLEGQDSSDLDPCQGKLQKDLDFVHILMYVVLVVKLAYTRD